MFNIKIWDELPTLTKYNSSAWFLFIESFLYWTTNFPPLVCFTHLTITNDVSQAFGLFVQGIFVFVLLPPSDSLGFDIACGELEAPFHSKPWLRPITEALMSYPPVI